MKLKVRFEDKFQTIELDAKATEEMWITLSIEADEDITQEEKEQLIQSECNNMTDHIQYNCYYSQKMYICFFSVGVRLYKILGIDFSKRVPKWHTSVINWAMPIITNTIGGVLVALILFSLGI